jgi:hypothetical protein
MDDKPIDFATFRIERGITKVCRCFGPVQLTLDYDARLVYCSKCNAILDPFEALKKLADYRDRLWREAEAFEELAKEARKTHRRTVLFRNMERQYLNPHKMYPTCPHCKEPFGFENLTFWIHPLLAEKRLEELEKTKETKGEA